MQATAQVFLVPGFFGFQTIAGLHLSGRLAMPEFEDLSRLVRRNDAAVRRVLINGRVAWAGAEGAPGLGREAGFGQVLSARFRAM